MFRRLNPFHRSSKEAALRSRLVELEKELSASLEIARNSLRDYNLLVLLLQAKRQRGYRTRDAKEEEST